jgi:type II secretion system protein H
VSPDIQRRHAGFTLLEILLVIVIFAVSTALIAPSFFAASSPSLRDEARRLNLALKLASDEAALSNRPFRWSARTDSYIFETPDANGAWHAVSEQPFGEYVLPSGISIVDVQPVNTLLTEDVKDAKKNTRPVMARLFFLPQGVMTASEIVLAETADSSQRISIQLRPGPGGIQISKGPDQ